MFHTSVSLRMVHTCPDVINVTFSQKISKGSGCELWPIIGGNGAEVSFMGKNRSQECNHTCSCGIWGECNFRPLTKKVSKGDSKSAVIGPMFKWTNNVDHNKFKWTFWKLDELQGAGETVAVL